MIKKLTKNWNKDNFVVVKKTISNELAEIGFNYLLGKKQVYQTLKYKNFLKGREEDLLGTMNDGQVKDTYSIYGDIFFETLLCYLLPKVEDIINTRLYPTYAYARFYEDGSELKKHEDRKECELSTTLNLGGDTWPIFIEKNNKPHKISLEPGDMLVYKGSFLTHWREPFRGEACGQCFLHYNEIIEGKKENLFGKRIHLGLPKNLK